MFHDISYMTNYAKTTLLANGLTLKRERPIAYTNNESPLNQVDVRWFAAPIYSQPAISPPLALQPLDQVSPSKASRRRRGKSIGRGPSLRLKTLFASPLPHNRMILQDTSIHPYQLQKEPHSSCLQQLRSPPLRSPVEGKQKDDLSNEDKFWLRNTTTHIYQQHNLVNENWLIRKLSLTKLQLSSVSVNRLQRQFSFKRATETVIPTTG
ncbi:hypothetical protein NQZ79_g754 [Umbelopsis isabellina]|nr:hypothetical protein NQZ79_g754 [Umbelopsis isabellina]